MYSHKVHYATITPQAMQSSAMNAIPGFGLTDCAYPLPIMATWPYNTINETTGVRVAGTTYATTIQDNIQIN